MGTKVLLGCLKEEKLGVAEAGTFMDLLMHVKHIPTCYRFTLLLCKSSTFLDGKTCIRIEQVRSTCKRVGEETRTHDKSAFKVGNKCCLQLLALFNFGVYTSRGNDKKAICLQPE